MRKNAKILYISLKNRGNVRRQWYSRGGFWGLNSPFVANVTSYLVTFIRIVQNLCFNYPS